MIHRGRAVVFESAEDYKKRIDDPKRKLHLDVSDAELERRRTKWRAPKPMADRGYVKLYIDHVNQADEGADLEFLVGGSGTPLLRESH